MADSGTNSRGNEAIVAVIGADFGQASELGQAEVGSGTYIDEEADREENSGRDPTPWRCVDHNIAPVARDGADPDPHGDPCGDQHAKRRSLLLTPLVRARMDHEPEKRDRRIDDAGEPRDGTEKLHNLILQVGLGW